MPSPAAVGRAKERRVFDARVDRVWVFERRLKVPDALELLRALRAVVELVSRERLARLVGSVVDELVALALGHPVGRRRRLARGRSGLVPSLAAVVRALNYLAEPSARLRRVNPVGVNRRALQVVDLPAREVRAG